MNDGRENVSINEDVKRVVALKRRFACWLSYQGEKEGAIWSFGGFRG